MKRLNFFLVAIFFITGFISCKKDQYYLYDTKDKGYLQFGYTLKNDTVSQFTFFYHSASIVKDTVFFDIFTVGGPRNQDRAFNIEQELVPGAENAIPGVHFKAFDDPEMKSTYVIKAGAVMMKLPIVILRDPSLQTKSVELKIRVKENENFKAGENSLTWRKLVFTDKVSKPAIWDIPFFLGMLGKYSVIKHSFMIEHSGQKWDQEFMSRINADIGEYFYWMGVLKAALIEYNQAHPLEPLTDEFGEVSFPGA